MIVMIALEGPLAVLQLILGLQEAHSQKVLHASWHMKKARTQDLRRTRVGLLSNTFIENVTQSSSIENSAVKKKILRIWKKASDSYPRCTGSKEAK